MKEYKALISKFNGEQLEFVATEEEAKRYKNISNLIFKEYDKSEIKKIDVALWNDYTKKYFNEVTYDSYLEQLKDNNNRVEITYNFGDEEETSRCYIGKSTGWIPCYLEIKKSNSTGGGGLLANCIKNIKVIR